jgi:hypothetical protein
MGCIFDLVKRYSSSVVSNKRCQTKPPIFLACKIFKGKKNKWFAKVHSYLTQFVIFFAVPSSSSFGGFRSVQSRFPEASGQPLLHPFTPCVDARLRVTLGCGATSTKI